MEEPKNPDTCNVFTIYSLLADQEAISTMREKYLAGNFGYGHAKQALYETIIDKFKEERKGYQYYMENISELNKKLEEGEEKARAIARKTLSKVRERLGF